MSKVLWDGIQCSFRVYLRGLLLEMSNAGLLSQGHGFDLRFRAMRRNTEEAYHTKQLAIPIISRRLLGLGWGMDGMNDGG